MSAAEWASSFFSGLFVELWLQATPEEQTRREADFLEKVLGVSAGAKVLDVPCGGGRHCLELATRGFDMTGVDISTEFLLAARADSAKRHLPVTWEQRAMQDLPWDRAFDGAFCMGNSLGGLEDTEFVHFLQAVARALKPGSRFVVDTGMVAESIFGNVKERGWWQPGDILFLVENRYDPVEGKLNMDFTLIRGGRTEKKAGFSRVHTYREFCRLFEHAGFHDLQGYASLDQEPFRLGSPRLLLVATNKGT
jgi:SAM-dependent methyltransferase